MKNSGAVPPQDGPAFFSTSRQLRRRTGSEMLRRLEEATRLLQERGADAFDERLFAASNRLFDGSVYSFEMVALAGGSHYVRTDAPFDPGRMPQILERVRELVPRDNPIFPRLVRGESRVMRLSDFLAQENLHRTELYQDVFRDVEVEYQMVIPITTATHAGALTVNRGTVDYTDDDIRLARRFASHVRAAFEAHRLMASGTHRPAAGTKSAPAGDAAPDPGSPTRLPDRISLTPREREVLWWIGQGRPAREIAGLLSLNAGTVARHLTSVLRKLDVPTPAAAVRAMQNTDFHI